MHSTGRICAIALAALGWASLTFGQTPPLTIGASDGPVTIIAVEVNGLHSNQIHVAPGATFTVNFLYSIVDVGCPACIDQIQVGLANDANFTTCAYNGEPTPHGVTRESKPITLTAPTTSGIYYVAFDRGQNYYCAVGPWWSGTPQTNQYIAAIGVY